MPHTTNAVMAVIVSCQLRLLLLLLVVWSSQGLQTVDPLIGRREILQGSQDAMYGWLTSSLISNWDEKDVSQLDDIEDAFAAKQLYWKKGANGADDWNSLRYGTSSLPEKERIPNPRCQFLTPLPLWMEGYWLCNYKFGKARFPQGRDKLTLQVPGAGLGTCLALPNVGYNPAPFCQRINLAGDSPSSSATSTVEDVAYNLPRKLEAFWPQAKVTSIKTATSDSRSSSLGPACLVTGQGCSPQENPYLHGKEATRCRLEFQGPTRRGGMRSQEIDLSLVASSGSSANERSFLARRHYVQYNVQQELMCYYQELLSFTQQTNGRLEGRTRVAAFLPPGSQLQEADEENALQALAIYDYTMEWKSIDSDEAASI